MSALLKSRVTHPASLLCPALNHELHVLCRPSSAGASQLRSWSLWSISRLFHWWFYFSPWAVTFIQILPTSNRQPEHLPSFSLVQATCLAQIGQFPLPVCALPPTRFSFIGERYFYTPDWWQGELRGHLEFANFPHLLSTACRQASSTPHPPAFESVHFSPPLPLPLSKQSLTLHYIII